MIGIFHSNIRVHCQSRLLTRRFEIVLSLAPLFSITDFKLASEFQQLSSPSLRVFSGTSLCSLGQSHICYFHLVQFIPALFVPGKRHLIKLCDCQFELHNWFGNSSTIIIFLEKKNPIYLSDLLSSDLLWLFQNILNALRKLLRASK